MSSALDQSFVYSIILVEIYSGYFILENGVYAEMFGLSFMESLTTAVGIPGACSSCIAFSDPVSHSNAVEV
jgi:hypothetical protein